MKLKEQSLEDSVRAQLAALKHESKANQKAAIKRLMVKWHPDRNLESGLHPSPRAQSDHHYDRVGPFRTHPDLSCPQESAETATSIFQFIQQDGAAFCRSLGAVAACSAYGFQ